MKKYLSYIFLLLFAAFGVKAQKDTARKLSSWQIKPVINTGFILVHRITIGHLVKGYPAIYEMNVSKRTLGNKLWHLENNKPDMGISFQCIDFKNPAQLGYAYTLAPFVEIPLCQQEHKMSRLILRLCFGATYITKHFDIHQNPKNIAIGSHVNAFVQFKWFWHLQLTKHLRFEPGFAFTHASNGKFRNPNLGLNIMSLNAGLNYVLPTKKPTPLITEIDSSTKAKSKHEILTYAAIGFNQHSIASPKLKTYMVSAVYQRNVSNRHKFSAGFDFFCDQNYFVDYKNTLGTDPQGLDKMRIAARVGYSYNMGRISFPFEVGYYVLKKTNPDAAIVTRIGARYYTSSGLILHWGLRTHFAVAYCFEYGLGYRFNLK
ncbi:MAG: acyloxyacyl hydrolase [Bacteroidetes bacterium]|nr:acyloxyacyl hydrolase [Bacteroidota bacterium]